MNFLHHDFHSMLNFITLLPSPRFLPFLCGWIGDRIWGDPEGWWHPVVTFGKAITFGEKHLNCGTGRQAKGAFMVLSFVGATFAVTFSIMWFASLFGYAIKATVEAIGVFYCLAGKTLASEVRRVFEAVERSEAEGRKQVSRIVGRDTSALNAQEIRTAALETLAENLSDGVIAPMFWYFFLGLPGMMAYKMINTLDSMIGYRSERYREFGCCAARLDDAANFIPARITALLMLHVSGCWSKLSFVRRFGRSHSSPNSGYPEAALAAILDCRFGGTHSYFGEEVEKPYIGTNNRLLDSTDLKIAIMVNERTELVAGIIICLLLPYFHFI